MRTLRALPLILSGFALMLGLACGGASHPPAATTTSTVAATGLAYADPTGTGWRLMKDASSTSNRLVLNLIGPSGLRTRGVGFNLSAPGAVKFGAFSNGLPINDLNVYQLRKTGSIDPAEPVALTGGVKPGNILSAGIYQKDRDQSAQDSGAALCQIVLSLDTAQAPSVGTPLALSQVKAKVIPEDIGRETDDMWTLDKKMRMADIAIAIGTLSAQ